MKAHKLDMIYAWAKDAGVSGFDHLDPKAIAKQRQYGIKKFNESKRNDEHKRNSDHK
tara:strand:- start:1686 stop:1856 length:171 start_codon:yes stop_codon:yes gene_type:complete